MQNVENEMQKMKTYVVEMLYIVLLSSQGVSHVIQKRSSLDFLLGFNVIFYWMMLMRMIQLPLWTVILVPDSPFRIFCDV